MSETVPAYRYLETGNVDDLGRILIALVQETWAMRDRMAIIEKLLAEHTGITAAAIDDYAADAATRDEIEKLRSRFVGKVIGAPLAAHDRSVDQILDRAGMVRPS